MFFLRSSYLYVNQNKKRDAEVKHVRYRSVIFSKNINILLLMCGFCISITTLNNISLYIKKKKKIKYNISYVGML